jgi:tetratricopeptide (TPR) repeat protein
MNNPVDLPFAALYILAIHFILRLLTELPRPSWRAWVPLLVGIPLAADVRIAGLVLLAYLVAFVPLAYLPRLRATDGERASTRELARALAITLVLCAGCYLLVSVSWPLAHRAPLTTPLMALAHLSRLETFNALDLFEGRWINRWELPWYFVPKWLLIAAPLYVPLGLALSPVLAWARRPRRPEDERIRGGLLLAVGWCALFPILFVILRKSNVYNDARHLLFVYPPLVVWCAAAWEGAFRALRSRAARWGLAAVLAATMLEPLRFMARNHPNEVVYFSPLVGGVDGAWQRYETDYWGSSVRQAVEWIQDSVEPQPDRPLRVRLWYGDATKARHYLRKKPGYRYVEALQESDAWDYEIVQTVACKYFPEVLRRWPPPGTVHEVKADRTPLCAVVANPRSRTADEVLGLMQDWVRRQPSAANYHALGLTAQRFGRHAETVAALERAVELDPERATAWSSLAEAYGMLRRWEETIGACREALALDAGLESVRDRLVAALVQQNQTTRPQAEGVGAGLPSGRSHTEYLDLQRRLYQEGRYAESAEAARLALRASPASAVGHHGLCVAYGGMGRWAEAVEACETAVALQPGYRQARQSLERARTAAAGGARLSAPPGD